MPTLSTQTREAVQVALGWGYLPYPHYELLPLGFEITQASITEIEALLTQLTDIDTKLTEATADSMAVKVEDLSLSYPQHIRHLKSEGSRLLNRISNLIGLKMRYNKYASAASNSLVSYW